MKIAMQVLVAIEEIYVNIANYAYGEKVGRCKVIIDVKDNDGKTTAIISLRDSGIEFDPLGRADPDITLSAEERQIGGLGIYMVKKSMDKVTYQYINGENILTVEKSW